jgi:ribosomal protein S18 acetylase RimI-like enzyme
MPISMEQQLSRSPELIVGEISLRTQTEADDAFLKELYASVRWSEVASTGWPDGLKHAFLEQQRALQTQHYVTHYNELWRGIVLYANRPVGRMYLWQNGDDLRIVDLSLLESRRGQGIGTQLLRAVIGEATLSNACVSLHVEQNNPARQLYQRLGFSPEASATSPYIRMSCKP